MDKAWSDYPIVVFFATLLDRRGSGRAPGEPPGHRISPRGGRPSVLSAGPSNMATKSDKKAKKKTGLAAAASKRLARIGGSEPRMSPDQVAHVMMHAEERGEAERVPLDDGTWGWKIQGPDGRVQVLKPTAEMLAALERFTTEGHPPHDDE